MKKFFKILGVAVGAFIVVIIAFLIYFNSAFPKAAPLQNVKVEITPERIARGEYLAYHVTGCIDCHSRRDFTKYAGPLIPSTLGEGGERFDNTMDSEIPGVIYSYNITPAGIGDWTDGELIRAITTGVTKNGKALFPLMPYQSFNHLSKEDLYSIVAYIRSLKPIKSQVPESKLDFPMNLIVKTIPLSTYTPAPEPDKSDTLAYGKYLVTIAGCADCHTPMVKGTPVAGLEFAGGMEFHIPGGTSTSANITPDNETGIGKWTKPQFIHFFKSFASDSAKNISVKPGEPNTIMPLTFYAGITEEDLGAIYTYLRTLKPVHHEVVKFAAAN